MRAGTNNSHGQGQHHGRKDNLDKARRQVYRALSGNVPKTMRMVEQETGVRVASQCQYLNDLQDMGLAVIVRHAECRVSGYVAGYYSTNWKIIKEWKQRR